jgi:hypothetical protein
MSLAIEPTPDDRVRAIPPSSEGTQSMAKHLKTVQMPRQADNVLHIEVSPLRRLGHLGFLSRGGRHASKKAYRRDKRTWSRDA